ncbi:MAG: bifunctional 4-hydroxy-2-oxoglutarate aldolase/2-dehydro-3-deoxy-phosphogluconate aldolase [Christensenellales bacterium]
MESDGYMDTLSFVRRSKIIAIVRGLSSEYAVALSHALFAGGIELMEVTFDQSHPETWVDTAAAITAVCRSMGEKMLVGAGTVITSEQLHIATDAGAKYVISPNTDLSIIRETKSLGLASFPGAMTPSEIEFAHRAGADIVKVFPAGTLGVAYVSAIRSPLRHIEMIAVGGINPENATSFLKAGCCGIGVGGNLVNKSWIEAGEWDRITALAAEYRRAVG